MASLAERITRHYGGDWHGTSGNYPAEGHSRRDRGVSIKDAPDAPNGVVLHVHNGGDAIPELDRLRRDNFLPKFEPKQRDLQSRQNVAIESKRAPGVSYFEYPDADGVVVCRKKRIDRANGGKDFQWEHPDGKGGWCKGRGCDPLPYRLPDLLAAPVDAVVYVAEEERKADKLASWGLVATSSKDLPKDLTVFVGRKVVILPDNDDQGRKIANDLQNDLEGVAGRVVQVILPGLPTKGDIIDWHGSKDELAALVAEAMAQGEGQGTDWPALDLTECSTKKAPAREWLIDGWIPANKATLLAGDGGVGKSLLAQIKATCVAIGQPFMGTEARQANAAYLSWEDDAEELWRRQEAICEAMSVPMTSLAGRLHLVSYTMEENPFLVTADDSGLRVTPLGRKLERIIDRHKIGLLILDNASQVAGIDHNAVDNVAPFAHWLGALATRNSGAVVLLHHTNKQGQDYLGSVAYNNQFRSRMLLARPEDCHDPDLRELTNPKANYAQAGSRIEVRWYKGAFVREEDLPPNIGGQLKQTIQANKDNEIFLACLAERNKQQRAVSERASKTFAPTVFAMMPDSKRIGKARLEAAMDRLFRIGKIERAELWKGSDRKPVFGLRETAGNGAVNTMRGTRVTGPEGAENLAGDAGNTHTIYKYISGAAPEASAPFKEEEGPDISRVVFAAEIDPDHPDAPDTNPGWD